MKMTMKANRRLDGINPLSTNEENTPHDTVVTSESCNSEHSENMKKILTFSCKSMKFPTKCYTKLCNFGLSIPEKLHYKLP